jgi:hypothetical protein
LQECIATNVTIGIDEQRSSARAKCIGFGTSTPCSNGSMKISVVAEPTKHQVGQKYMGTAGLVAIKKLCFSYVPKSE